MKTICTLLCFLVAVNLTTAQAPTLLKIRGCSVIPAPQIVRLAPGDVSFDAKWRLDNSKVGATNIAVRSLLKDLTEFHSLKLQAGAGTKVVSLFIIPDTVTNCTDPALAAQAYRLTVGDKAIEIIGNAQPGLFYGVQTFLHMLHRDKDGGLVLPKGTIEDWPVLQLRFLHWDTKHHQNRMETIKRYLDWTARFKANMIGFELEDKFEYPSHPIIGAPGAYTTAELQEIVNYGLERHIQVVPVIQAPAHLAYVLKHPQFADLRADGNNYQSKLSDPRTYDLIFSMYDDVIKATRGVDYLFVSTDEVYYAGIEKPNYNAENRSLAYVEFVRRAHDHLAKQNRRMLIWAEYPLLTEHVSMIPPDVIDGVGGDKSYIPIEKKMGMRQLAYVSMQGEERLFPNHLSLPGQKKEVGHLDEASKSIATGIHWQGNPIGAFGAAWDDSGLHSETFWIGWSCVAHCAWSRSATPVQQHIEDFFDIYYGPKHDGILDIYAVMQRQARAWESCWDSVTSKARGPGYGNSRGKGQGTGRSDMTLLPPALPRITSIENRAPIVSGFFAKKYEKFISEASSRVAENDELLKAIDKALSQVERNRYNLEVYQALAKFMGHHWRLLQRLAEAEKLVLQGQNAAQQKKNTAAAEALTAAAKKAEQIRNEGETVFAELRAVFEKSRYPKGQTVAGRNFVHIFDDTKDHWADRTPGLDYMIAPERSIGLEKWQQSLEQLAADLRK